MGFLIPLDPDGERACTCLGVRLGYLHGSFTHGYNGNGLVSQSSTWHLLTKGFATVGSQGSLVAELLFIHLF